MGGVLKSWAVPKGPCLDPSQKRLAVEVEDHPLAYGDFEGLIPAGEYGGGTVMRAGTRRPGGNRWASPRPTIGAGEIKFTLEGTKLKGSWVLVRKLTRHLWPRRNLIACQLAAHQNTAHLLGEAARRHR